MKELPKWFDGDVYEEGQIAKNPYSGETYVLDANELSMYDYILGCQYFIDKMGGPFNANTTQLQKQMAKGLAWFRQNNAEAYMILLD